MKIEITKCEKGGYFLSDARPFGKGRIAMNFTEALIILHQMFEEDDKAEQAIIEFNKLRDKAWRDAGGEL